MPTARVNGIDLYYEDTGQGFPLAWSHEFGGDHRSWEPQVRYFARRYRVITYNHRGYPPSEVPKDPGAYSPEALVEDLHQLLRHLGVRQAHVGSGTVNREAYLQNQRARADELEREGIEALVRNFETLATRRAFRHKDPRGWDEFVRYAREHDAQACAHLIRGVIVARKTIFELEPKLHALRVPTLVMTGDQDEPCLEPSRFMRQHLPHAGLLVVPMTGHTVNIEEPGLFNLAVAEFLTAVENGRWGTWSA